MIRTTSIIASILALALSTAGSAQAEDATMETETMTPATPAAATASGNALLAPWTGPFGGVPAFDRMDLAALEPALEAGMAMHLAQLDAIVANPEPPTFENTIVALERAGKDLDRVMVYRGIWNSNLSSPEYREINVRMAPRLAEFNTRITQNAGLFERIQAVHRSDLSGLRPDQRRLVQLVYDRFARNGATLTGEAKARHAEINRRLAELQTRFSNNVLADEEGDVTYLSEDQLGGLPESFVRAAAAAAAERGRTGAYAVTNTRSSMDPFLTYSDERALRERVWRTYYDRGDNGDEHDNNALIVEILKLRHERSRLLGYPDYATWRLEDRMAGTPEKALGLLEAVWPAAIARVREEVADMQAIVDREGGGFRIAPWDYRYYAEKVRQARYELDSDEVKQYLQLEKLVEALHFVAGEVFQLRFAALEPGRVPVYHPDVRVWEVTHRASGDHVGLWYLDPFARQGKRSGAWASTYRGHETFDGPRTTLGSNNSNFIKGTPGEPVLISADDARTLFHEFGHALHALASNVAYPTLNGGVRDFTEFQSQLLEHWLLTDAVIDRYLVHVETGAPMPDALVAKIRKAATFNQGFETTEYLASAIMDLKYHTMDPQQLDVDAFERETLAALGMPAELVMRHRSPHFSHVFSSEGYAAGYYGYMWADVLTADAAEAFAEAPGGFYDAELAGRMVAHLFAPRNSVDPAEAYRAFRGRDAKIEALLRDRGFPVRGDLQ